MLRTSSLRQRGMTLLEIILVVAVGLGLIFGGIFLFGSANASYKTQQATTLVASIVTGARKQAASHGGNYFPVTTQSLLAGGHIPESLVSEGRIRTPAGSAVLIGTPVPFTHIVITLLDLDSALCRAMLSQGSPLRGTELSPDFIIVNRWKTPAGAASSAHCLDQSPNEIAFGYQ